MAFHLSFVLDISFISLDFMPPFVSISTRFLIFLSSLLSSYCYYSYYYFFSIFSPHFFLFSPLIVYCLFLFPFPFLFTNLCPLSLLFPLSPPYPSPLFIHLCLFLILVSSLPSFPLPLSSSSYFPIFTHHFLFPPSLFPFLQPTLFYLFLSLFYSFFFYSFSPHLSPSLSSSIKKLLPRPSFYAFISFLLPPLLHLSLPSLSLRFFYVQLSLFLLSRSPSPFNLSLSIPLFPAPSLLFSFSN